MFETDLTTAPKGHTTKEKRIAIYFAVVNVSKFCTRVWIFILYIILKNSIEMLTLNPGVSWPTT